MRLGPGAHTCRAAVVPNAVSFINLCQYYILDLRASSETLEDGTAFIVSCATSVCPICDLIIFLYRGYRRFRSAWWVQKGRIRKQCRSRQSNL